MQALIFAVVLVGLAQATTLACDEACAPGFVFDDAQGVCVRMTTS